MQLRTPPTQSILESGHINFENQTHTHTSECLSSSRKKDTEAATHPSQQPDDANCSHVK